MIGPRADRLGGVQRSSVSKRSTFKRLLLDGWPNLRCRYGLRL